MKAIIETERLTLREWTQEDADVMFVLTSDAHVMRHIGDGRAWNDLGRVRSWIERTRASYAARGYGHWAVVERTGGAVIGSCGFSYLKAYDEIDLGYLFAPEVWGRGYATEAAGACLRYGFARLGFAEVTANTDEDHIISRRVLEKIGFEYRGPRRYDGDAEDASFFVARNPNGTNV